MMVQRILEKLTNSNEMSGRTNIVMVKFLNTTSQPSLNGEMPLNMSFDFPTFLPFSATFLGLNLGHSSLGLSIITFNALSRSLQMPGLICPDVS